MLILSRRPLEGFSIGENIVVTVRETTEGENVVLLVRTPDGDFQYTRGANGIIEIAEGVSLEVYKVTGSRVRLGITAPKSMVIDRR